MQSDDPPFLTVGTEVSARFKGAFCEAKIKKVTKSVKVKLLNKDQPGSGAFFAEHTQIKSDTLEVSQIVEVQQGKSTIRALIQHIKDCSTYHVVFNDGDEKTLRRTQMCLKGARHFDEKASLDAMPLYNPEQWINHPDIVKSMEIMPKEMMRKYKRKVQEEETPTKRKRRKNEEETDDETSKKREKRAAASAASVALEEMDQGDTEVSDETSSGDASDVEKEKEKDRKKAEMEKRERSVLRSTEKFAPGELICVYNHADLKGSYVPALVVSRPAFAKQAPRNEKIPKDFIPYRSFGSSLFAHAPANCLTPYSPSKVTKKLLEKETIAFRIATEKATAYAEKQTLPPGWKLNEIVDDEKPGTSRTKDKKEEKKKEIKKNEEVEEESGSEESSDEESDEETTAEERDFFVAQLYKFEEDRGMPINRAPVLGGKDIDLYRFHRTVRHYGGSKKINANNDWKRVLVRMKLDGCPGATPVTIKKAYVRYLKEFSTFYRRLGIVSQSGSSTTPRDRRVLLRGPVEDKRKKRERKPGDKESTVEKESSVESKDDRKEKEGSSSDGKKDEKKRTERKKEDSESTEASEKDKKSYKSPDTKNKKKDDSSLDQYSASSSSQRRSAPRVGKFAKQPPEDVEYELADCFTQFYLGQKVNACHDGHWYDARVIGRNYTKAPDLMEMMSSYVNVITPWPYNLPDELIEKLKKVIQDTQVTVHYLGWNSRYDEVIPLAKVKSSTKDQEASMIHFKPGNPYGINFDQNFLNRVVDWVRSPDGIGSANQEDTVNGLPVIGMGGYRPRRMSVSQYEQLAAAALRTNTRHNIQNSQPNRALETYNSPPPPSSAPAFRLEDARRQPRNEGLQVQPQVFRAPPVRAENRQSIATQVVELPSDDEEVDEENEARQDPTPPLQLPIRPRRQRTVSTNSNRTASPAVVQQPLATPSPAPTTSHKRSISPPKAVSPPRRPRTRTTSASEQSSARPSPAKSPEKKSAIIEEKNLTVESRENHRNEQVNEPVEPTIATRSVIMRVTSPLAVRSPSVSTVRSSPAQFVRSPPPAPVGVAREPTPIDENEEEEDKAPEELVEEEPTEDEEIDEEDYDEEEMEQVEANHVENFKEDKLLEGEEDENAEGEKDENLEDEEEEDEDEEEEEEQTEISEEEPERPPPRRMGLLSKDSLTLRSMEEPIDDPEPDLDDEDEEDEEIEGEEGDEEMEGEDEEEEDGQFDQMEDDANNVCNSMREDESDSDSANRTDEGEDGEEGDSTSTPGGTKIKRKKHTPYSNMVVDRKYTKRVKASKPEAKTEEEDEESAISRESFNKRKNAVAKQMEASGEPYDISFLRLDQTLEEIENESDEEEIITILEERILELREAYAEERKIITELDKIRRFQDGKYKDSDPLFLNETNPDSSLLVQSDEFVIEEEIVSPMVSPAASPSAAVEAE